MSLWRTSGIVTPRAAACCMARESRTMAKLNISGGRVLGVVRAKVTQLTSVTHSEEEKEEALSDKSVRRRGFTTLFDNIVIQPQHVCQTSFNDLFLPGWFVTLCWTLQFSLMPRILHNLWSLVLMFGGILIDRVEREANSSSSDSCRIRFLLASLRLSPSHSRLCHFMHYAPQNAILSFFCLFGNAKAAAASAAKIISSVWQFGVTFLSDTEINIWGLL